MKKVLILMIAMLSFAIMFAAPLNEGFEGTTFPPEGWTVVNGGGINAWTRYTYGQRTGVACASIGHNTSAHDDWLITPKLAPTEGDATFIFWAKNGSTSWIDEFNVLLSTTTNEVTSFTEVLASNVGPGDTYTEYSYDISAYNGQIVYLAIQAISADKMRLYVDDVTGPEIYVPPYPIFSLTPDDTEWDFGTVLINTTATKEFSITNTGGGTLSISDVSTSGDFFGLAEAFTAQNLGAGESYTFSVEYTPGVVGTHSGTLTIDQGSRDQVVVDLLGECYDPTISTFPWTEDFGTSSSDTFPPRDWTRLLGIYLTDPLSPIAYGWIRDEWLNGPIGNNAARVNIYGTSVKYWLVSPPIAIPATGYELKFDLGLTRFGATTAVDPTKQQDDKFIVLIANNPEMTGATPLRIWDNDTSEYVYNDIPNTGTTVIIDLDDYVGTYYVAFYGESTSSTGENAGDNDLFVDNVIVRETPSAPIISVSPDTWDFGLVEIGVPSTKVFTVGNTGGGVLELNSVSITDGTDNFSITVPIPDDEMNLATGESTSFTAQFLPTNAQLYSGTITIGYAGGNDTVSLDGEGYTRPAGSTCENPYIVTLPLEDFIGDTAQYGDDYSSTWITPNSNYLNGNDMVLKFTLDSPSTLEGTLTTTDSYIGIFILQEVPNSESPATAIASGLSGYGSEVNFSGVELAAGDYFAIISSWPSPQTVEFTLNVTATALPTDPIFAVDPDTKVFGDVQVGTELEQVFTISNTGYGQLGVTNVALDGDAVFSLIDSNDYTDLSLGNGEFIEVTVKFSPITVGDYSATLSITDDVTGKAVHEVEITGSGFDSTIYSLPWIETFEDGSPSRGAWSQIHEEGTSDWTFASGSSGGSIISAFRGQKNARFVSMSGDNSPVTKLVSPPFNLTDFTEATLEFYLGQELWFSDQNETKVYYRISSDADWNELAHYTENLSSWTKMTVPLPEDFYQIAIEGINNYGRANVVDDIRILKSGSQIGQGVVSGGNVDIEVPELEGIASDVNITGLADGAVVNAVAGYGDADLPNAGLSLTLSGASFSGSTITITHGLGFEPLQVAFKVLPNDWVIMTPTSLGVEEWNDTIVSFTLAAKADGDVVVVFPLAEGDTLPITLSAFTAVLTSDMYVNIAWAVESETDHAGYNILRSEVNEASTAIMINSGMIHDGVSAGTQIKYSYLDTEVYHQATYYYWLESVSLSGEIEYFGPLMITISADGEEPGIPEIPLETKLFSAFPNPFNPSTNLRYSMKEAGDVRIDIYNVKGQILKTFTNNHNLPGYYQVSWDGRDMNGSVVGTGVYFYRMTSGRYRATKKMVLAK